MSTRFGDASGRVFTDYTASTIRNEDIALEAGLDPWDGYGYRRYLMESRNAPMASNGVQLAEKRTYFQRIWDFLFK